MSEKMSVKACCEDDAQQEGTHSTYCDYHPGNLGKKYPYELPIEIIPPGPIELLPSDIDAMKAPKWVFPNWP